MKIAIVGGGITGLSAAHELLRDPENKVTLFEPGTLGGLAAGYPFPETQETHLEKFYHHLFLTDKEILALIEELGLSHRMMWRESTVSVYAQGRMWPFTKGLDLLRFTPMKGLWQRLLFGLNALYFRGQEDWRAFDEQTVEEFYTRRGNRGGYEAVWRPLLKSKFGDNCDRVSAAFLWGRIFARFRSRKDGKEVLGYMRGGFHHLITALAASIERRGAVIKRSAVQKIALGASPTVRTAEGVEEFDHVLYTANVNRLDTLIEGLPAGYVEGLAGVKYMGVACLVLSVDRKVSDTYWINICDKDVPFGGIIEHTNLVGAEGYAGRHVLYVFNYLAATHPYMGLGAEELLEAYWPALKKMFPALERGAVKELRLFKADYASPVYEAGYYRRVLANIQDLPGLSFATMAQIYPFDRNMSHCIATAHKAVAAINTKRRESVIA